MLRRYSDALLDSASKPIQNAFDFWDILSLTFQYGKLVLALEEENNGFKLTKHVFKVHI